jgi:ribosomal protein uL13
MKTESPTMIVLDANGATLGRLASYAAKQSLLGKAVSIVNCEKAVITGGRANILSRYKEMRAKGGSSQRGPYFPTKCAAIMKRTIRGMLSHKEGRGHAAFMRIRCYEGIPASLASSKAMVQPKSEHLRAISLTEVSQELR